MAPLTRGCVDSSSDDLSLLKFELTTYICFESEVAELLRQGRVSLVDTREAPVFARAHLPSAANIPLEEIESRLAELHMLPGAPVLYCRSGDQTKEVASKLAEQGVPVSFLEGGVLGWEASGFELERPD